MGLKIKAGDIFRIVKVKAGNYAIQRSNPNLGEDWSFPGRVEESVTYVSLDAAKERVDELKKQERWLSDISEVVEIIDL
jgi:hypothetical protein